METTGLPSSPDSGGERSEPTGTYQTARMIKVPGLHPKLAEAINKLLAEAKIRGLSVALHSGLRTWDEQARLYELGRSARNPDGATEANPRGNIVTKTVDGYSWHNYGIACDIVFRDVKGNWTWDKTDQEWEDLGKIGELYGLTWGGRWKQADKPHFELKMNVSIIAARKIAIVGSIEDVWKEVS